ncbi:MAG: T9SS type A sorting domain-containing protein [candidate division Zixibacteria bacterium]|nr:T9SS type A sorting domain-containing protein [candidate division Zixibacteria bacterium]
MIQKNKVFQLFLMAFIFWVVVFQPGNCVFAGDDITKVELTDQQRAYLILRALSEAIENPTEYNLDILTPAIGSSDKEIIRERIRSLIPKVSTSNSASKSSAKMKADFNIKALNREAEILSTSIEVKIDVSNLLFSDTITLNFKKKAHYLEITNIDHLLDRLENLDNGFKVTSNKTGRTTKSGGSESIMSVTIPLSDNMFLSKQLNSYCNRFNAIESQTLFNGDDIFNRPYGVAACIMDDPNNVYEYDCMIVSDANWDRLIVNAKWKLLSPLDSAIFTEGSHGDGDLNFISPMGIDNIENDWFIVDAFNNRVVIYTAFWSNPPTFARRAYIDYCLDVPVDVASDIIEFPSGTLTNKIAILSRDNSIVTIWNKTNDVFSMIDSLFSFGPNDNQLDKPTSICFGKNYTNNYAIGYLYITDNGNGRIIRKNIVDTYEWIATPPGLFEPDAYLTSISADRFGSVYVVDSYNSMIYLLDPDLTEIIAVYGSQGIGDKELTYPNHFEIVDGFVYASNPYEPLILGEALVTEHFGTETGIRRYEQGCEVLNDEFSYMPSVPDQSKWLDFDWTQSGTSVTDISVTRDGIEIYSENHPVDLAGDYSFIYEIDASAQSGNYALTTRVQSIFGTTDTIVENSVYVAIPKAPDEILSFHCDEVEVGDFEIGLSWDYSGGDPFDQCECDSFDIFRDDIYLASVASTQSFYTDESITEDCSYTYKIRSRFGADIYSAFSPTTTNTPKGFQPTAPTIESMVRYATNCWWRLDWADSSFNEDLFWIIVEYGTYPDDHRDFISKPRNSYYVTYYNPNAGEVDLDFNLWAADSSCQTCNPLPTFYCSSCFHCSDATVDTTVFNANCTPSTSGCPTLYVWNGQRYEPDNSIMALSQSVELATSDFTESHHIKLPLIEENGTYRLQIIENDNDVSTFDRISLAALDRESNIETVMDKAGAFYSKDQMIAPTRVVDHNGFDVTRLVMEKDGNSYFCYEPGYLDIEYQNLPTTGAYKSNKIQADENPGIIIDRPPKEWPDNNTPTKISPNPGWAGIPNHLEILIKRDTTWEIFETIYGKKFNRSKQLLHLQGEVDSEGSLTIRYQWNVGYRTDQIAYINAEKISNPVQEFILLKAEHSKLGNIKKELTNADGINTALSPNDTITLIFQSLSKDLAKEREFVLITKGRYASNVTTTFFAEEITDTVDVGGSFKLSQNYPNPSNPSTTFEFAIPQSEHVNLVIYNILGQAVKTLTNQFYEAGSYKIRWDGGNDSGGQLASGIYFAKLIAGDNVSTKKVVVLK